MDMGPYYLTAMVNLLGGVSGLTGVTAKSFETRTITSEPLNGTVVEVEVPTHVTGIMNFDNGAVGTILTTFDVYHDKNVVLEVYGTEGTLFVPDPNGFGGPVKLLRPEDGGVKEIPLVFDYKENSRGLGVADMARAILTGREFRADYTQTLHVLEIMTGFQKSSESGQYLKLESSYVRRAPMRHNAVHGVLD